MLYWQILIGLLSFFSTLFAGIAAWKSYLVSRDSKNYKKELDDIKLKPQLFLKKCNKSYQDYVLAGVLKGEKLENYNSPKITLVNISNAMIFDLNITIKIKNTSNFSELIQAALSEENGSITKECIPNMDEEYGGDIAWDNHRPLMKKRKFEKDILSGNEEYDLYLPAIFTATLKGVNYLRRNGEKFDHLELPFKIDISYKHAFSNEIIEFSKDLVFDFNCTNDSLQGPEVQCDSMVFDKL